MKGDQAMTKVEQSSQGGSKPGERRSGRQKGTPNKVTLTVKQAVFDFFAKLGGVTHMAAWAKA